MKKIALLSVGLLLAACTPQEQQQASDTMMKADDTAKMEQGENPAMMPASDDAMMGDEVQEAQAIVNADGTVKVDMQMPEIRPGAYLAYNASVLTDGTEKVLFFHAGWCPLCKNADADLKAWYGDQQVPLSVYKVDYDTETELKTRYGVTYQHTFVKVDGQGNVIEKIQTPSDAQLQALIGLGS